MSEATTRPGHGAGGTFAPASAPGQSWAAVVERKHLPALDGMRAIAVFMVILGHLGIPFMPADLGVTIFFVLSGFLITLLLLREEQRSATISLRRFYIRRSLRIFPAYFVYLAFTFSLDTALGDLRWKQVLLPALTYTVNYYNALHGHPTTSVAHAWSLAVEEQFYLFWPLIFLLLVPKGRVALTRFLIVAIFSVIALRSWLFLDLHVGKAYVYNAFETRFDSLAMGCLLAVAAGTPWLVRVVNRVAARLWMPVITLLLLFGARYRLGEAFRYGPGLTLEALLVAILLIQLLVLAPRWPWQLLEVGLITYLGRLSYSLYLYHGWGSALGGKLIGQEGVFRLLAQIAGCIVLAMGSYHIIEMPFLRLKRRFESVAK